MKSTIWFEKLTQQKLLVGSRGNQWGNIPLGRQARAVGAFLSSCDAHAIAVSAEIQETEDDAAEAA